MKRQLVDSFEMADLGILHFFSGLQVAPPSNDIFIFHSKYALYLLKFLKIDNCKPCDIPFQSGVKLTKEC